MTNYEIAEKINALCDDDFFEVFSELGKMHNVTDVEGFCKWLLDVLTEIGEKQKYEH